MQKLIEFYEMVSLNDAGLGGIEKAAIVDARRALLMFERAMESLRHGTTEPAPAAEIRLSPAA